MTIETQAKQQTMRRKGQRRQKQVRLRLGKKEAREKERWGGGEGPGYTAQCTLFSGLREDEDRIEDRDGLRLGSYPQLFRGLLGELR